MSTSSHEEAFNFGMTHPLQEGWIARGLDTLPREITTTIAERYRDSSVNTKSLLGTIDDYMNAITAQRHSEEIANLGFLCLHSDSDNQEVQEQIHASNTAMQSEYAAGAGKAELIPEQIGWLAHRAATLNPEQQNEAHSYLSNKGITLELGGTRQYGLWTYGQERTSKEVDDATWYLAGSLARKYPEAPITSYSYEGSTPIRYRAFPVPQTGSKPEFVVGRRRRAVLDIDIDGQRVEIFKQFRGLIVLGELCVKHQAVLEDQYRLPSLAPPEKGKRVEAINRVTGTIMREAIYNKEDNPLSVCPLDVSLIMRTGRKK